MSARGEESDPTRRGASGERVVVAMSGGVDSSVAAALLVESGRETIGVTMRLSESGSRCCSLEDGEIDWPAHLAALKDLGYDGYLCVETHYEPFRASSVVVLAELRAMLADIPFPETPWP